MKEIGRAPAMSPIGSGLRYGQTQEMALYPKRPRQVSAGYSLWNDSQAALFQGFTRPQCRRHPDGQHLDQ